MNPEQLIISVGVILVTARVLGLLFRFLKQPQVIGEMIAGSLLGPSFFGLFFPVAFNRVFPVSSLPILTALSQLGLLLFMFMVGMEVDLDRIAKEHASVAIIGGFSIVVPMGLGMLLARYLFPEYAGAHVPFVSFALFMGTAMSITAFPVLARILRERNLLKTELGSMAIACAAVNDVSAWILLATLTGLVHSSQNWRQTAVTLGSLLAFLIIMLLPVRWAATYLQKVYGKNGASLGFFSTLLLIMFAVSWTTEHMGVHALFGAFMAGLIMPKDARMIAATVHRIEMVTLVLLLPIFFALTGLRTQIGLLRGAGIVTCVVAVIAVAIAGKLAGASIAARATGMPWKDSLSLGVLMNTRGLVELVVLNAGLELGILSATLFTVMVVMALFTTMIASPILALLKKTPAYSPENIEAPGFR